MIEVQQPQSAYCCENCATIQAKFHVNDASRAVTVAGNLLITIEKYMQAILEPNMMLLEKPFEPFSIKTI
jgi:hypothetical protein